MRTKSYLTLIVFAAGLCLVTAPIKAAAQQDEGDAVQHRKQQRLRQGDGKAQTGEQTKKNQRRHAYRDRNRDGYCDLCKSQLRKGKNTQAQKRVKFVDKNGDGICDRHQYLNKNRKHKANKGDSQDRNRHRHQNRKGDGSSSGKTGKKGKS